MVTACVWPDRRAFPKQSTATPLAAYFMEDNVRILIADDDAMRAEETLLSLRAMGHLVEHVITAVAAETAMEAATFDLVILYLGLEHAPGPGLVTRIRLLESAVPILALARGTSPEERIAAMDEGADDCVSAPVSADEVRALVRVWYRRALGTARNIVRHGPLSFNATDRAVFLEGEPVRLSRREVSLLEILLQRRGRVVSKYDLMDCLLECGEEISENCIEVYVYRLRKKIERGSVRIDTLRGQGYCLEPIAA